MISSKKYKTFEAGCTGASKLKKDIICQDFFMTDSNEGYAIAVVSDGLGSSPHFRSNVGSKFACEISIKVVKSFFKTLQEELEENIDFKKMLKQLVSRIIYAWREQVKNHLKSTGLTEDEKEIYDTHYNDKDEEYKTKIYAATFVLAVMSEKVSFVIQTGDSPCLVFDDEACITPQETINPNCDMGFTTTLADTEPLKGFMYYITQDMPKAIFVCSDGIRDSYTEKGFFNFGMVLLKEFEKNHDNALDYLKDYLPKLSEEGSADDMSIAGIYLEGYYDSDYKECYNRVMGKSKHR